MNPERYINKKHDEGLAINEKVEKFFDDHPRSKKTETWVADKAVKEQAVRYLSPAQIPEELQPWYANLRSAGVSILEDGFLEIPRWEGGKVQNGKIKPLHRQKVDGLPSAIRMQEHILNGYYNVDNKEEIDEYSKLESMQEVIEYANELLNQWRETDENDRTDLQMKLADVVLQLARCRNEFKLEVREQTEAVTKLKDSRGRDNPGALAARTVAAINRLTERFGQMQLIAPLIALRKEILELEERRIKGIFKQINTGLVLLQRHPVFQGKKESDKQIESLDRKLGQLLYKLDTVHIAPYLQQATQAKFFLEGIKKYFRSSDELGNNLELVISVLEDAQMILQSDVSHFG